VSRPRTQPRRRAERWGRTAETLCSVLLRLKGYRIVGRRVRTAVGEIDLVARRGQTLAIIEVKARADAAAGLTAVSAHQRHRIERAAEAFLAVRPQHGHLHLRFDVMVVRPFGWPMHVADAWRPEA